MDLCNFLKIKGFIQLNGLEIREHPNNQLTTENNQTIIQHRKNRVVTIINARDPLDISTEAACKIEEDIQINESDFDLNVEEGEEYIIDDGEPMIEPNEDTEEYLEDIVEEDTILNITIPSSMKQQQLPPPVTEKTIKTNSLFIPPVDLPQRLIKNYTDEDLTEALEELKKGGCSVLEISEKCNVPRSTIYAKLRQNPEYRLLYRSLRDSVFEDAVRAVVTLGMSLKDASTKYNISKTALWRKLKQSDLYKPEERSRATRTDALQAIGRGETLLSISKQYNVPLSTLHRDKVRLFNLGKLPQTCTLAKRDRGASYKKRLKAAVMCCENGMTQKLASELHSVPKTTVWRHLQNKQKNTANVRVGDSSTTNLIASDCADEDFHCDDAD